MAQPKKSYICTSCGAVHSKWAGQCDDCGEWNTIIEDKDSVNSFSVVSNKNSSGKKESNESSNISYFSLKDDIENVLRINTSIEELNRVFGGGLVKGSAVLVGGEPGIGKSTLLLQMSSAVAANDEKTIYITGEESVGQVSMRAKRLGLSNSPMELASATNVESIIASIKKEKPSVVIIDSIQTMFLPSIDSSPGTVSQVRFCAHELINLAKKQGFALILVGHVTKDGQIAGPRVLEHMVDTVLYFEGEKNYNFRILRSVKNRFGPANEIGVFEMQVEGLVEVKNPSSVFISGKNSSVSGSVIFAGVEGTRPLLVEVQALVSPSYMATPRRAVVGWDSNRLAMIIAVLQTRCNAKLYDKEVYLNIAGGIKVNEPAADLAVAAAIISALNDKPMPIDTAIFGEVGLSGEVRPVSKTDVRLKEASKLGFKSAILPKAKTAEHIELSNITHISDLMKILS